MDDADLRRGFVTIHKKYDEVTAILVGDALNSDAFRLIANAPLNSDIKCKLVNELSLNGGIGGMVLGQAIDCHFENQTLKLEELIFLHTHKTAKLIAASLKMGAIICNLEKDLSDRLFEYGLKLGLLFQIQDDIIDATMSESEAGKSVQNDSVKNSFVNLLGLDGAREYKKRVLDELYELNESFDKSLADKFNQILDRYF
jgi:farnesyl diphosphate synthase